MAIAVLALASIMPVDGDFMTSLGHLVHEAPHPVCRFPARRRSRSRRRLRFVAAAEQPEEPDQLLYLDKECVLAHKSPY